MKKLIAALAVVPMVAAASASAQEEPMEDTYQATHEEPAKFHPIILRMLAGLRDSAILLTAEGCEETFGKGWVSYGAIEGRFPLAAGTRTDKRNEERTFDLNPEQREGGTYRHVLKEAEMPGHHHEYVTTTGQHDGRKVIDYGDDQREHHSYKTLKTQSTGGGEPHNNMPPYLVLNFCKFQP